MFGRFGMLEPYVSCHRILEEDQASRRGALWLGDYQAALDKVGLKLKGIRTVVSVVSGIDLHYDRDPGIMHRIHYIHDSPEQDIQKIFDETFLEIENGLATGSVLVHCVMGISRSASTVIAYLMKKFNFGFSYAYNYVQKRRPIICPNYGFCRQLKEYQKKLQKEYESQTHAPPTPQNALLVLGKGQLKSSRILMQSPESSSNDDLVGKEPAKMKHSLKSRSKKPSHQSQAKDQQKLHLRNISFDFAIRQDRDDLAKQEGDVVDQSDYRKNYSKTKNRNMIKLNTAAGGGSNASNALGVLQRSKQISTIFPTLQVPQFRMQQQQIQRELIILGNKQQT